MPKSHLKSVLEPNLFLLKVLGIWPRGPGLYKYDFYLVFAVFYQVFIMGGQIISLLINLFFIYDDVEALADTIFLIGSCSLACMKAAVFVWNLKSVKLLLAQSEQTVFRAESENEDEIVKAGLQVWTHWSWLFYILATVSVNLYLFTPFLTASYKAKRLPVIAWYPFNTSESPNYQIMYFTQIFCGHGYLLTNVSLDTTMVGLMAFIQIQCKILHHRVKNMGQARNFQEDLIQSIKHYKEILMFSASVIKSWNLAIFLQFAASILVITFTMFQLAQSEPLSRKFVSYSCFVQTFMFQVFLYCYFGNEVRLQSNQLSYGLFESAWFNETQGVKKTIFMFVFYCQEAIKIHTMNIFFLTLETFLAIVRTTFSYFSVLHSMEE